MTRYKSDIRHFVKTAQQADIGPISAGLANKIAKLLRTSPDREFHSLANVIERHPEVVIKLYSVAEESKNLKGLNALQAISKVRKILDETNDQEARSINVLSLLSKLQNNPEFKSKISTIGDLIKQRPSTPTPQSTSIVTAPRGIVDNRSQIASQPATVTSTSQPATVTSNRPETTQPSSRPKPAQPITSPQMNPTVKPVSFDIPEGVWNILAGIVGTVLNRFFPSVQQKPSLLQDKVITKDRIPYEFSLGGKLWESNARG